MDAMVFLLFVAEVFIVCIPFFKLRFQNFNLFIFGIEIFVEPKKCVNFADQ